MVRFRLFPRFRPDALSYAVITCAVASETITHYLVLGKLETQLLRKRPFPGSAQLESRARVVLSEPQGFGEQVFTVTLLIFQDTFQRADSVSVSRLINQTTHDIYDNVPIFKFSIFKSKKGYRRKKAAGTLIRNQDLKITLVIRR